MVAGDDEITRPWTVLNDVGRLISKLFVWKALRCSCDARKPSVFNKRKRSRRPIGTDRPCDRLSVMSVNPDVLRTEDNHSHSIQAMGPTKPLTS